MNDIGLLDGKPMHRLHKETWMQIAERPWCISDIEPHNELGIACKYAKRKAKEEDAYIAPTYAVTPTMCRHCPLGRETIGCWNEGLYDDWAIYHCLGCWEGASELAEEIANLKWTY